MARTPERQIEHLLRRAGFGARPDELDFYGQMSVDEIVDSLVEFDSLTDDVDSNIGKAGFVGTTTRGVFSPNSNITYARQRWLFRRSTAAVRSRRRWYCSAQQPLRPATAIAGARLTEERAPWRRRR
jgi:hypothetical protein